MTKFIYSAAICVKHDDDAQKIALANQFATICDPDSWWDTHTYELSDWVYTLADDQGVVKGCGTEMPSTETFRATIESYNAGGYPPELTDAGVSEATIDYARTFITASVVPVADAAGEMADLAAASGLYIQPEDEV